MAHSLAERFMKALQGFEESGEVGPLLALFSEQAQLENLASKTPSLGKEGARQFWEHYRSSFQQIHSTFTHVIEGQKGIVLEWVSRGTQPDGKALEYRGVSILEPEGEKVRRFSTYYDTSVFLMPQLSG